MSKQSSPNANQPAEPAQRRPLDWLWFAILIVSIATGIGMTIFAPV